MESQFREIIRQKIVDALAAPAPALTRRDVRLPAVPRKALAAALADLRLDKIRLFNAVNIEQGYKPVSIYISP